MIELSDEDILSRLTNTEDTTVERKVASDYRDCLKTAVAFSNSLPIDDPGVVFVGVRDDGRVQDDLNLESLQRNVSLELTKIYPPIYPQMKVLRDADGKEFLALIVRGSPNRPHFAGQSFIRDGTQTKVASEEQFERLIGERSSKTYQVLKYKDKSVTLSHANVAGFSALNFTNSREAVIVDCNQFYVSCSSPQALDTRLSLPLAFIELSFDDEAKRLRLIVRRD